MTDTIVSASVPVTLDGRELVLRYRAHAFIQYAESCGGDLLLDIRELGQALNAFGADAAGGITPANVGKTCAKIADILWAGLIDQQPDIARADISRMFSLADFNTLLPAIMQALQMSMPQQAERPRPTKAARHRRDSTLTDGASSGPDSASDAESQPASSAA